ncbi:hypothetical protein PG994_002369 [Apiospora phragmitis]|uniref:Uncharacterized protein n=1 Tax=Apiospora phragmitis TaxID=2905665 RepID=A0ABR1WW65_9PEZI
MNIGQINFECITNATSVYTVGSIPLRATATWRTSGRTTVAGEESNGRQGHLAALVLLPLQRLPGGGEPQSEAQARRQGCVFVEIAATLLGGACAVDPWHYLGKDANGRRLEVIRAATATSNGPAPSSTVSERPTRGSTAPRWKELMNSTLPSMLKANPKDRHSPDWENEDYGSFDIDLVRGGIWAEGLMPGESEEISRTIREMRAQLHPAS